jgi:hypothetical protein
MKVELRATLRRVAAIGVIAVAALAVCAPAQATLTGGSIEVCLAATNDMGGKTVQFSLNGGAPMSVKGGRAGAIEVTPGPITVNEVDPDTAVMAVDVKPSYRAISAALAHESALVAVPGGSTVQTRTIVTFTNAGSLGIPPGPVPTTTGTIEICADAANGMTAKAFQYSLNGGSPITVNGGACSGPPTPGTNIVTQASNAFGQTSDRRHAWPSAISLIVHQQATVNVPAGRRRRTGRSSPTRMCRPGCRRRRADDHD